MSFVEILDTLLLKPLQLIFEVIYAVANRLINNPGASIIVLSLVMNFLVLPLYRRADAMQEDERQMEMKLQKGVAHIKKTFKGDEQMMMLRTYYRQNNYKPTYVLRGAASLFLEIPFFIAAYRFLSDLQILNGISFGLISDLGSPDAMLQIHGMSINILPFIMTAVNLCSCIIFTKDSPRKTKLQLYGMAAFFLVFLYSSPSGLVFYWTLNNIFSLVKTILYKLKNPRRIVYIIFSTAGIGVWIYGFLFYNMPTPKLVLFFALFGMFLQLPLASSFLKKYIYRKNITKATNKKNFFFGALFLTILTGVLIPSAVIKSSPQEFVSSAHFYHPIWFIVSSFCMACGVFVIWLSVFYWLAGSAIKPFFDRGVWIFSGIAIINYMFFDKNFGNLTSGLKYENELEYRLTDQLINLLLILVSVLVLDFIYRHFEKKIYDLLIIGIAAAGIMSTANMSYIDSSLKVVNVQALSDAEIPNFTLSKTGKNVIVLMLDRAMGEQIPYIFDEKPELKKQFDGFTYYSNTISFGYKTNFGFPALLGGYEYTPVELNKRDSEPLVSKHNEALKVMPVLFDQNNYKVTVINPVYANYQWVPDLTIYDDYPSIKRYTTAKFADIQYSQLVTENNKRNFFCYSILKSVPLCFQKTVYNEGKYNQLDNTAYSEQHLKDAFTAEGMRANFMEHYTVLEKLSNITNITEVESNTFLLMVNDTTHEPMLLQEPDYVPSPRVDNTKYEDTPPKRTLNGRTLKLESEEQMSHYHVNMAAMIQLGKWFDYMRREGVYENTRIILVSDHGRGTESLDELILNDGTCVSSFFPLLMVKDFGNTDFTTSDIFMTNADVPCIATMGIIEHPVNPFTGKTLNSDEKTAHDQYVIDSDEARTDVNNGNTFLPANWYSIHDNMWDKNNWKLVAENAVLPSLDDD